MFAMIVQEKQIIQACIESGFDMEVSAELAAKLLIATVGLTDTTHKKYEFPSCINKLLTK